MKKIIFLQIAFGACAVQLFPIISKPIHYGSKLVATDTAKPVKRGYVERLALDYWTYLTTGTGEFIDLITPETKEKGFVELGLLKEDVDRIEEWIRSFQLRDQAVFEFACSNLPAWLAAEYDNLTDEVALNLDANNPDISNKVGQHNIRLGLLDSVLRVAKKPYVYMKKTFKNDSSNSQAVDIYKQSIELDFINALNQYQHIDDILN
ncbi:MAG: hypothetical protein NTZ68_00910 [Candidatus Dependentiae bacterium]|nr:hypothetical protein [Candidatus Dependentiae bacterium]